jgi:hypothetical protein
MRVVFRNGHKHLLTSSTHRLLLRGQAVVLAEGPRAQTATATQAPVTPPPPSEVPPGASRLALEGSAVELIVGSAKTVALPSPITGVTTAETAAGTASGVTVAVSGSSGAPTIAAAMTATIGETTLTVSGEGCTSSGCGILYTIKIPVTVAALAPPPGPLTTLTEPSPARAAAAIENDLVDELEITVGPPETPGTRAEAEADADGVEGIISGGLEGSGIYQVRWTTPQDLAKRTTELEARPGVTSVSPATVDLYTASGAYPVAPEYEAPEWTWPYAQVHATEAWAKSTGSDVTVGIIDEGNALANHQDLDVTEIIGAYEPKFHATHVAGLACAKANNVGVVGLAQGCPIVSVGGAEGSTDATLNDMKAMAARSAVKVVNMSIGIGPKGGGCANATQQAEIDAKVETERPVYGQFLASREGQQIVWTFSAGNNCAPGVASPWAANSQLPNVISVAATNSNSTLADFSNFGPGVSVAAPGGVNVSPQTYGLVSTATDGECPPFDACPVFCFWQVSANCGTYKQSMGTSMAAPVVAGIAADVRSANPNLTADKAGECVTLSAGTSGVSDVTERSDLPDEPYEEWEPNYAYSGTIPIVNAAAAVECAQSVGAPPTEIVNATTTTSGPVGFGPGFASPACGGSSTETAEIQASYDGVLGVTYGPTVAGGTMPAENLALWTDFLSDGTHHVTFECIATGPTGTTRVVWTASGFDITLTGTALVTHAAATAPEGGSETFTTGAPGGNEVCPTFTSMTLSRVDSVLNIDGYDPDTLTRPYGASAFRRVREDRPAPRA